jgi:hypothetical protein
MLQQMPVVVNMVVAVVMHAERVLTEVCCRSLHGVVFWLCCMLHCFAVWLEALKAQEPSDAFRPARCLLYCRARMQAAHAMCSAVHSMQRDAVSFETLLVASH